MTTLIIPRTGVLALFAAGLLASVASQAQESPHWSKTGCQTCHMDASPVEGAVNLTAPDAETLCETCHGDRGDAKSCRHGSGLAVGDMTIADNLRASLKDGEVVCSTCHDVVYQCEHPRVEYSYENPSFLRDRTSRYTAKYCFNCHDGSDYEKLNPHQGFAGTPARPTCRLCHESIPETDATGKINVVFNMQHDLNDTCRGCHTVGPHPRNLFKSNGSTEWVHFVQPSSEVLENMRKSQAATGIALPLNPQNGEIFCATCHNPHDFKLGGEHGSEEQVAKNRLRLNNICQACHDK